MRNATRYDKETIIEMMKEFRKEAGIPEYDQVDNVPYWNKLLDHILAGAGVAIIEEGKGIFLALITHTVWCDKTFYMQELAWYVRPEQRNETTGYRLLKEYIRQGKSLVNAGRIKFFCIAKLTSSPDIKYEKFGFRKLDDNWIQ